MIDVEEIGRWAIRVPAEFVAPKPIAGQCLGCTCYTRDGDFTTNTFGVTVRRAGTCRRSATAVEDVLAGLE